MSSVPISFDDFKYGNSNQWKDVCEHFKLGLVTKANALLRHNRIAKRISPEDIVQETMLKAWQKREQFKGETKPELAKWLLAILRNTFLDYCKKHRLEVSMPASFDHGQSDGSPSKLSIFFETEALLQCKVAELDETTQRIIKLRLFDGLKFHEIADRLGLNPNTTASLYRRGVAKLHDVLSQEDLL